MRSTSADGVPRSGVASVSGGLASRLLAAGGALLLAVSVALAAYGAHGVDGLAQSRLQTAAAFAFGHGLALAALAPFARTRLAIAALFALLLGTLLFSGAITTAVLFGTSASLAPVGGTVLIAAWLIYAFAALRGAS